MLELDQSKYVYIIYCDCMKLCLPETLICHLIWSMQTNLKCLSNLLTVNLDEHFASKTQSIIIGRVMLLVYTADFE